MGWRDDTYKSYINKKVFFDILDDSFNDTKKDIVESNKEQKKILLKLRKHIERLSPKNSDYWSERFRFLKDSLGDKGKHCSHVSGEYILQHYNIFNSDIMDNYLFIKTITSSHTRQSFYMVIFFKNNELNIEFPVYGYIYNKDKFEDKIVRFDKYQTTKDEIIKFVDALMKKQKELEGEAKGKVIKQEKVKALKSKTIISKIKDIMKEKDMTYKFEEKRLKIILTIKLSKSQVVEISITYKKFQSTLQRLSDLIDQLVELYEQGIEVKHKQTHTGSYRSWINDKES